jgi:hypothetical protein
MAESSKAINRPVVNFHVEIAEKPESEPAPVQVAPQEEPRKEEQKLSQKLNTPAAKPDPGAKPSSDAATNGKTSGVPSMPDWIAQDQAFKQSTPQNISDGGRGVSN